MLRLRPFHALVATLALLASPVQADPPADFEVPLIVQEVRPRFVPTVGDRVQELVTVGIPLPEDSGVSFVGQLGMRGVTAAKLTALARWDTGGLKWVLADFLADVPAGSESYDVSLTAGSGGFGGPHMATEETGRIVIETGPARFEIPRNAARIFDRVVVDGVELISPGNASAIIARDETGRLYSSASDPSAQVVLENNGPVRAVVTVKGRHTAPDGTGFLDYTLRMEFARGQRRVHASYTMRNARYAANRHARSRGIELVLDLELGQGPKRTLFGAHAGATVQDSISTGEEAYYYQAYSAAPALGALDAHFVAPLPRNGEGYLDNGYRIVAGGRTLVSEADPELWPDPCFADVSNASGQGVSFGIRFLPYLWPGALECDGNGRVKVGLFTPRTNHLYTWNFGVHETREFFLDFHACPDEATPADVRKKALAFQYPLKARVADIDWFNRCGVISDKLVSVDEENRYYALAGLPHEKRPRDIRPYAVRFFDAGQGGGGNQLDKSYHQVFEWMRTGLGGLYIDAELMALYRSDWATFHSDDWVANYTYDPRFPPAVGISNDGEFPTTREHVFDNQHCHNRHQPIFYYLTGDPRYRDSFIDNMEGRVFSPKTRIVDLRTSGTRIYARTSWLLREAWRFLEDIDAVGGYAFNRDHAPPLTREEIGDVAAEYLQWGLDLRYFRDGSGWSDEPLEGKNDRRHFWAGGKNRYLYEEVIFHVANLFPDALWNIAFLSAPGDPLVRTVKQRIIDLNSFVWNENIVGHCLDDPSRRGNYYRYFTFDRGTGAVPPSYPECGGPTPDSGSYDNHPCFQLFIAAYRQTNDPIYLHRARNFLEGQILNGGIGRNGDRTDFQSAIYWLLRALDDQVPPGPPRNLVATRVGDHEIELAWDEPAPAADGDCFHKYAIYRNGALLDGFSRRTFLDPHVAEATTFQYEVRAVDSSGKEGLPVRLGVTTLADQAPPRLLTVHLPDRADRLELTFSEPLDAESASRSRNYAIEGGVTVTGAQVVPNAPHRVLLSTTPHDFDRAYAIRVAGVVDCATPAREVATNTRLVYRSVYHEDDFEDGVADGFLAVEGTWRVHDGVYEKVAGDWKARTLLVNRPFEDFTMEVDVRIPDRVRSEWIGFTTRTKSLYTWPHGGYLVYLSNRGTVAVHNARAEGNPGLTAALPLPDPTGWHRLRAVASGGHFRVWVDDVLRVDWSDPDRSFTSDWINLHALAPVAQYDNLKVGPPALAAP